MPVSLLDEVSMLMFMKPEKVSSASSLLRELTETVGK